VPQEAFSLPYSAHCPPLKGGSGLTVEEKLIIIPEQARLIGRRKLKILEMLSHGWTAKEMGVVLHVSETTVKRHLQQLRDDDRFRARNSAHLVAIAYEKGILGGKVEDVGSKEG
jgi:DNA-binding NarL/FixJ family response regulator